MNSTDFIEVSKIYDLICLKDSAIESTEMENGTIVCIKIFLDPMRQKFLYIHPNSQYQSVLRDYDFHSNRAELLMIKNVRVLNEDDLELVEIGDDQIYRFVETNWMSDPSKVLLKVNSHPRFRSSFA